MKLYFAPMEGITGYIYRNAYHSIFHPMDKYFTPFIAPKQDKTLNSKERNDILPEHNQGMYVVPVSYTHLDVYKRQVPRRLRLQLHLFDSMCKSIKIMRIRFCPLQLYKLGFT